MDEKDKTTTDQVEKLSVSLYPNQVKIIRRYADESHRSFSNSLQVIIEEWFDHFAIDDWSHADEEREKVKAAA